MNEYKIKSLKGLKFRGKDGYYKLDGYGLHVEGKGFVTYNERTPYSPCKKAVQCIIDSGGFTEEPLFVNEM